MRALPRENRFAIALVLTSTIALTNCRHRVPSYEVSSVDGVRVGARAFIVGSDTLRVTATAESVSNRALQELGTLCHSVNNLAVTAVANSSVWDSRKWEIARIPMLRDPTGRPIPEMCVLAYARRARPGGLLKFALNVPVSQVLGDSLPSGKYKITARIDLNRKEVTNIPAGIVELRR